MILYYAIGGGLGHITRAQAIIHTLQIKTPVTIIASIDYSQISNNDTTQYQYLSPPALLLESSNKHKFIKWLYKQIDLLQPDDIYVDTFPCGIYGEFCNPNFLNRYQICYIARILKWEFYINEFKDNLPYFKRTYIVENLESNQKKFIMTQSQIFINLNLVDPDKEINDEVTKQLEYLKTIKKPLWFIIHYGSIKELDELLKYAVDCSQLEEIEPQLIYVSTDHPTLKKDNIYHIKFYPAYLLFPFADRIFTGCGFNSMRQTEKYAEKHHFIPFTRKFDNQFLRASRRHSLCKL